MEQTTKYPDYKGLLDRLEIVLDRLHKSRTYSWKRRKLYHKLGMKQLKLLRQTLEPMDN
ncbi:MAG: hypothetical protein AAF518_24935 [Spirochaetota bacterium]